MYGDGGRLNRLKLNMFYLIGYQNKPVELVQFDRLTKFKLD